MKPIIMPKAYNYIGIFLTFGCNLKCSYCINNFEGDLLKRKIISGKDWVRALNRIESRDDLPVSLQGGEPSMHPDLFYIINNLRPKLNIDILTNLQLDVEEFMDKVDPYRVKRNAPYASIRVSYHPETMSLEETIKKIIKMLEKGFSVGIWSVLHPRYKEHILEAQKRCKGLGIDFRVKEFLGEYQGELHGTYRYKGACDKKAAKTASCKTTELLADPEGNVFRCHHDVYKGINPIGSLLDENFQVQDKFRDCDYFGFCNPCDVKVKTNRFQQYGHSSVEIKL